MQSTNVRKFKKWNQQNANHSLSRKKNDSPMTNLSHLNQNIEVFVTRRDSHSLIHLNKDRKKKRRTNNFTVNNAFTSRGRNEQPTLAFRLLSTAAINISNVWSSSVSLFSTSLQNGGFRGERSLIHIQQSIQDSQICFKAI